MFKKNCQCFHELENEDVMFYRYGERDLSLQLQQVLYDLQIAHEKSIYMTMSVGISMIESHQEMHYDMFISQVDIALYLVKNKGRNCTVLSKGMTMS